MSRYNEEKLWARFQDGGVEEPMIYATYSPKYYHSGYREYILKSEYDELLEKYQLLIRDFLNMKRTI